MARWRRQYDAFAGPRYPGLIAYAQLLTGSRERADALVNDALRRTFSTWRRLGTETEVEAEIRRLIVARFLATADTDDGAAVNAAATEPVVTADTPVVAVQPANEREVDLALYAPPGEHPAPVTPVTDESQEDSPAPYAPHQSSLRAEVEKPQGGTREPRATSESDQTHAALAMLTPQARAITVLRHFDSLAAGEIAAQLGLSPTAVVDHLRASHATLRTQLRIAIADEPDHITAPPTDADQHVLVTPHSRGR